MTIYNALLNHQRQVHPVRQAVGHRVVGRVVDRDALGIDERLLASVIQGAHAVVHVHAEYLETR